MNMQAKLQGSSSKDIATVIGYRHWPQVLGARTLLPPLLISGCLASPSSGNWILGNSSFLFTFFQITVAHGCIWLEKSRSDVCTLAAWEAGKESLAPTLVSGRKFFYLGKFSPKYWMVINLTVIYYIPSLHNPSVRVRSSKWKYRLNNYLPWNQTCVWCFVEVDMCRKRNFIHKT